jgi:hypothetical protein
MRVLHRAAPNSRVVIDAALPRPDAGASESSAAAQAGEPSGGLHEKISATIDEIRLQLRKPASAEKGKGAAAAVAAAGGAGTSAEAGAAGAAAPAAANA